MHLLLRWRLRRCHPRQFRRGLGIVLLRDLRIPWILLRRRRCRPFRPTAVEEVGLSRLLADLLGVALVVLGVKSQLAGGVYTLGRLRFRFAQLFRVEIPLRTFERVFVLDGASVDGDGAFQRRDGRVRKVGTVLQDRFVVFVLRDLERDAALRGHLHAIGQILGVDHFTL